MKVVKNQLTHGASSSSASQSMINDDDVGDAKQLLLDMVQNPEVVKKEYGGNADDGGGGGGGDDADHRISSLLSEMSSSSSSSSSPPAPPKTAKEKRSEVYFHYEILRHMHPNEEIPEFNSYSDPDVMAEKYRAIGKKLRMDSSVQTMKRYMIISFIGMEYVLGKCNIDSEGFSQSQLAAMSTYDEMLFEIADKTYAPTPSYSVETRLLMTCLLNMLMFVVSKFFMKKTGQSIDTFIQPGGRVRKQKEEDGDGGKESSSSSSSSTTKTKT